MAMSLAGYRGRSRRPLTCSVCREVYRSPRLLPCFHSFCLDCLEGLIRHHPQFFPCPECRKPTAIPRNGALGFQMNFYIQEEDLERERNGPRTALCPNHQEEPLLFFCVPCDQPICLCCKLTKHDHHETQDLSEAAARCQNNLEASKDRLEVAIDHLTKVSADAHDNVEAVKQKESVLIQEVCAKVQAIMTRVKKRGDEVIRDIQQCSQSINSQLTQDARNIQQKLDCLLQLRQRVNHALSGASDAEKVCMEKEMRQGEGSEEELSKVKECVPATTVRPGLHCDHSLLNDDTLHQWLGSAVRLSLPFATAATPETVFPVYQCGQDGSCREVHTVFHSSEHRIYISCGGTAPGYAEEQLVMINDMGQQYRSGAAPEGTEYFYKNIETD